MVLSTSSATAAEPASPWTMPTNNGRRVWNTQAAQTGHEAAPAGPRFHRDALPQGRANANADAGENCVREDARGHHSLWDVTVKISA